MAKSTFTIQDALAAFPTLIDWPRDVLKGLSPHGAAPTKDFHDYAKSGQIFLARTGYKESVGNAGNAGTSKENPNSAEKKLSQSITKRDQIESGTQGATGTSSRLSNTLVTLRQFVTQMIAEKYGAIKYDKTEMAKSINADHEAAFLAACVVESGGDVDAAQTTFDSQYPALKTAAERKGAALDAIDADSNFDPASFSVGTPTVRAA